MKRRKLIALIFALVGITCTKIMDNLNNHKPASLDKNYLN